MARDRLSTADRGGTNHILELPEQRTNDEPFGAGDVDQALQDAVRSRLIADVPVGAFLSGGIDSSLVVSHMVEASHDVRTFSIGFDDAHFDESPYALAVARHLGTITLIELSIARTRCPWSLAWRTSMTNRSRQLGHTTAMLASVAREDVKVALSGDGGDELFGGYDRYRRPDSFDWHELPRRRSTGWRDPSGTAAPAFPGVSRRSLASLLRGLQQGPTKNWCRFGRRMSSSI